jgi:hypothetical protein
MWILLFVNIEALGRLSDEMKIKRTVEETQLDEGIANTFVWISGYDSHVSVYVPASPARVWLI